MILIEPVETLPNQLHVVHSLSPCCDNKIIIQVLNVSPSPITIFKGMSLGTVTLGDDVSLVCTDDTQTAVQVVSFENFHLLDLSESERSAFLALLSEFSDIFAPVTGPKGCTSAVKHAIPTTGSPIYQHTQRLPEALKATVNTEVQQMLDNIIGPSASTWSSQ